MLDIHPKAPLARWTGLVVSFLIVSCNQTSTETATKAAGARVESANLGLAIAELPADFNVETNDATGLVLVGSPTDDPGRIKFELGREEQGSVNIVDAAQRSKAVFESMPNGEFFGNQELITPIGSFFTARGAYDLEDRRIEELLAFGLHPNSNRLVRISFQYPVGEAAGRAPQFAVLLGEIEGYEPDAP